MIKINSQNSTYALEKLIGEGSFAKVYVGHRFTPLYSQENFVSYQNKYINRLSKYFAKQTYRNQKGIFQLQKG